MIQSIFAILIGVFCISKVEASARIHDTFLGAMIEVFPYIIVAQFCLYQVFSRGSSLMTAWLCWTVTASIARVLNSHFILNEGLDVKYVAASVTLMLAAAVCMKQA